MERSIRILVVLLIGTIVIASVHCASSWQYIDRDYTFRAAGVSFYSEEAGWMAGIKYSGPYTPLLLHTSDGGKTYDNDPYVTPRDTGGFVTIYMEDENHGLAAGEDFFNLSPCAAMTTNGVNWTSVDATREFICTCQSTQVLNSGQTYAMAAQWLELGLHFQNDGLQISNDGGNTWKGYNWNQGTEARYLSCASSTCFIAGGTWAYPSVPSNQDNLLKRAMGKPVNEYYLSHHLVLEKEGGLREIPHLDRVGELVNLTEFKAIVAVTTDGGKTFTQLLNLNGQGLYFNQISCPDTDHCWVVGSGVISEFNSTRAGWIYGTSDGGQTWTQQLHMDMYSFMNVQMINSTFGWAAGTQVTGPDDYNGVFFLTTDGTTWTQQGTIHRFSPLNLSVVDANYAYAAGFGTPDMSSLCGYVPSSR